MLDNSNTSIVTNCTRNSSDRATAIEHSDAWQVPSVTISDKEILPLAPRKAHRVITQQSPFQAEASSEESRQRRKMRWWFFAIGALLSVLWMAAVMTLCWHVFDVTRNLLSLLISAASAPALEFVRRFATYLLVLPMDDKEFELEKARIKAKASKPSAMRSLLQIVRERKVAQSPVEAEPAYKTVKQNGTHKGRASP